MKSDVCEPGFLDPHRVVHYFFGKKTFPSRNLKQFFMRVFKTLIRRTLMMNQKKRISTNLTLQAFLESVSTKT